MFEFKTPQPTCYACKRRNGKQYALIRKEDLRQAIQHLIEWQSYNGTFYNVSVKPYRGKHWNPDKFVWVVEG